MSIVEVMKKIDSFSARFNSSRSSQKKDKKKVSAGKRIHFSEQVESLLMAGGADSSVAEVFSPGDLEVLLDEVCSAGEKLKESPSFDNIRQYKKAVKKFIAFIVDKMVDLEEHVSGVNILKRKRFMIVNVIDQKLESLAAHILSNQQSQLNILSRIDEINGLLVDLMQ